jgi:hypothetical protein
MESIGVDEDRADLLLGKLPEGALNLVRSVCGQNA